MSDEYVIGTPHPNTKGYATLETKPSSILSERETTSGRTVRHDSGGGYERWRSYEYRDHTPGDRKEDVYVPVHRLAAVAWCYPDSWDVSEILADLHGKDVHHALELGKWVNIGESPNFDRDGLEVVNHGDHSEITNAQRKAWAKDRKRQVERTEQQALGTPDECGHPGCDGDGVATSPGFDGVRCLVHAKAECDGETIDL